MEALTGGYHLAYLVGAICVGFGILAAFLFLRTPGSSVMQEVEDLELELERGFGRAGSSAQAAEQLV